MAEHWYDDRVMVSQFAIVLEDAGVLDPENTDSYKQFINKPFKYNEIFTSWEELGYPSQGEDNWDEFTNLLVSADEDEDDEEE